MPVIPAVAASVWFPAESMIRKIPAKVPFMGKVKFTLAKLWASLENVVTFVQLDEFCDCGKGQNCRMKVELLDSTKA